MSTNHVILERQRARQKVLKREQWHPLAADERVSNIFAFDKKRRATSVRSYIKPRYFFYKNFVQDFVYIIINLIVFIIQKRFYCLDIYFYLIFF